MNPVRLKHRLPEAPDMDFVRELRDLAFVILIHRHADHLDLGLFRRLKDFPILWVIPVPLLDIVLADVEIPANRLIVHEPLQPIEIQSSVSLHLRVNIGKNSPERSYSRAFQRQVI